MVEHTDVQKFIQTTGIRTASELKKCFANEDPEILAMSLTYLTSKNRIRIAKYQSPTGPETIYYIPKQ